ncbi:MAG: SPOR domain-containing protein [Thermodesulfobacteriota bacterium]
MPESDKKSNGNGSGKQNGDFNGNLLNEMDEGLDQVQIQLSELQSQIQSPSEKLVKLVGRQKELCKNLNVSINKTRRIAYSAMGLALAAAMAAIAAGVFSFLLQSDIHRLDRNFSLMGSELVALKQNNKTEMIESLNKSVDENRQSISMILSRLEDFRKELRVSGSRISAVDKELKTISEIASGAKKKGSDQPAPKTPRLITKTWSVNFASFKNYGYARRMAVLFSKQGFPVEIMEIRIGEETWYRLYVPGFNSKEEAVTYALRVEQVLNLGSVWLGRN